MEFMPDPVAEIAPGGHAAVQVSVSVPTKTPPGRYVGLIRAATSPPTEIVVAVEVVATTPR